MRILLTLGYSVLILAVCVLLGAAAGWSVMLAPCEWFGSPFEGGCGYAAIHWMIWTAMLTTIVTLLSAVQLWPWLRQRLPGLHGADQDGSSENPSDR